MTALTRRHALRLAMATPALLITTRPALARESEIYQEGGIAIDGSDAVAYFAGNGPVTGDAYHKVDWMGAIWQFANAENAAAFAATPEAFAPQFGGYCAFAASRGYLAPTMPEAWTLYEGKLYLNANLRARELWLQDVPGNIAKGEANWPGILG
ncbi:YHS domain-containing (seleno)protein [Thetidibacter halocola]|uniref:YHS domain protein n=1 Tax=Thetidibacter halocola TaxID=2827239 RepID=A0A8J7WBZ1_9RHOB|nr:YHS domain-containing (seleno)protein [Thetidibacter halocola]MBS0122901.1 YHS domain protein [Thetidibacter halocola]